MSTPVLASAPPPPHSATATPHFAILDGLRGVAAIAVVLFHFMEFAVPDPADSFITHAYFAVDFFFCLSGFVIACAYDTRLPQMGVLEFLRRRLIRLHPLVLIGTLLGWLALRFDPFSTLYAVYASKMGVLVLCSALMVPYPYVPELINNLFPLNPPVWSLFWEYIINIVYALVLVRLPRPALGALLAVAVVALCYQARLAGNLAVGWDGHTFWGGAARVGYSFLAGILVYRAGWVVRTRLGFVPVALLLLAVFLIPFVKEVNWLIDPLVVVLVLPLLVALGAGAHLAPRLTGLCQFLGDLSYPLYMVHYPFLWVFYHYLTQRHPPMSTVVLVIGGSMLALGLLAWAVLVWADAPLRTYLSRLGRPNQRA